PEYRDHHWTSLLRLVGGICYRHEQNALLADAVEKGAAKLNELGPQDAIQLPLAYNLAALAKQLERQAADDPSLKAKAGQLLVSWAEGQDQRLAALGKQTTAEVLLQQRKYAEAAAEFEAAAAKLSESKDPLDYQRCERALIEGARCYRRAKNPQKALDLLLSFGDQLVAHELEEQRKNPHTPRSVLAGEHGDEVAQCYAELGQPEKARAAYVRAAELCPGITGYGDFLRRLEDVGGVPLREDRKIDVAYFPLPLPPLRGDDESRVAHLVSDGRWIYVGNKQGLLVFDPQAESWKPEKLSGDRWITCLAFDGGTLWVGTHDTGLWRCTLSGGAWQPACDPKKLPDVHVASLAISGGEAYVGVGSDASGGLVKVNRAGEVRVFEEPDAPRAAPTHIVVERDRLLARTVHAIHKGTQGGDHWEVLPPVQGLPLPPQLFAGKERIWASIWGHELFEWREGTPPGDAFRACWYRQTDYTDCIPYGVKAGYHIYFVTEHDGAVWFGGDPKTTFLDNGLYRFDPKTGRYEGFGPRDGFKAQRYQQNFEGQWVGDQLWMTTSLGLCRVTPRK
ncbi:MAG TPA: hypothetical protein VMF30_04795, partial [Pirellulales bacterium]|nr:hypothetical protein [Pirellulales bacterium]